MSRTVARNLLLAQALCSLFFAMAFVMASLEGALGARSLYLILMALTAGAAVVTLLLRQGRPWLAGALGALPGVALAVLLLAPFSHGLLSR